MKFIKDDSWLPMTIGAVIVVFLILVIYTYNREVKEVEKNTLNPGQKVLNSFNETGLILGHNEKHPTKPVTFYEVRILSSSNPNRVYTIDRWYAVECRVIDDLDPRKLERDR